jgi:transposase
MIDLQELVRLHRMGVGARSVARSLSISPNTERQYREVLAEAGLLAGAVDALPSLEALKDAVAIGLPARVAPQQMSSAEQWVGAIEVLVARGVGPQAIWDRLRVEEPGFDASLSAVKRICLRIKRARGVRAEDVVIRVDTVAGEVAQVDFGYVGMLWDEETQTFRKAWVFVLVLGHSRWMWASIVFEQTAETWARLHVEAFAALGGVPRMMVPDNLKAAVIQAAFGSDRDTLVLHRGYRELARHYGFRIDPAPPRAPQKKGKVESGVSYVKNNFMAGRVEQNVATVRRDLSVWLAEVANVRVHGTTGRRPADVLRSEESAALLPLPATPYQIVAWRNARVHPDSHIALDRVLYSVPFVYIGQQAAVRLTEHRVWIYVDDVRVAEHTRRRSGRSTYDAHLPTERAELRHRSRDYWEARAAKLGPEVGAYVTEVFDVDEVVSQLRVVQAIVTMLETYPPSRAVGACRRAQTWGNYTYRGVREILRKALDLEETNNEPEHGRIAAPRFARDPADFRRNREGGTA